MYERHAGREVCETGYTSTNIIVVTTNNPTKFETSVVTNSQINYSTIILIQVFFLLEYDSSSDCNVMLSLFCLFD